MKKLILLGLMLILLSGVFAYDLNVCKDGNDFASIGSCLGRGVFGGDSMFFALIFLLLFCIFIWQSKIPTGAAASVGVLLLWAVSPFIIGRDANYWQFMMGLIILIAGLMLGKLILNLKGR